MIDDVMINYSSYYETMGTIFISSLSERLIEKWRSKMKVNIGLTAVSDDIWYTSNCDELKTHVDKTKPNHYTQGLVIINDFEAQLQDSLGYVFNLTPGTVFRLDATKPHGLYYTPVEIYRMPRFFCFLAWDIPLNKEMSPIEFYNEALISVERTTFKL